MIRIERAVYLDYAYNIIIGRQVAGRHRLGARSFRLELHMIARLLFMGLVSLVVLPPPSAQPIPQVVSDPSGTLLHVWPLSQDITDFWVSEQLGNTFYKSDIISIELIGGSIPDSNCVKYGVPGENNVCGQYLANPPKFPRPLKDLAIQVWLLRADGTTVVQKSKLNFAIGNAGESTDTMMFVFDRIAPNELAGVVARVDGKLFVREIGPN